MIVVNKLFTKYVVNESEYLFNTKIKNIILVENAELLFFRIIHNLRKKSLRNIFRYFALKNLLFP